MSPLFCWTDSVTGRKGPLNDRQIEVLRWVGDGCPPQVWPNSTYKTVAIALQNRRLITISKKGGGWTAAILDAGRHYLVHGAYPDGHLQPKKQREGRLRQPLHGTQAPPSVAAAAAADRNPAPPVITPTQQLLNDIETAEGTLIRDTAQDTTPYGSLVAAINRNSTAPSGQWLVMDSGENYYQKIFHFHDLPAWLTTPPREVVEAPRIGRWHPVVAQRRADSPANRYGDQVRARAWRILHSIAMESEARGHTVTVSPAADRLGGDRNAHKKTGQLLITIGSYRFYVTVRQLNDRTPHTPTPAELAEQKKWAWSHPRPWDYTPGRRLSLEVYGDVRYGWEEKWTDSKTLRVRVESHLLAVLRTMESSVVRDEDRKAAELRKRQELARREDAAEPQVQSRHAEIIRAEILERQLTRWQHVRDLRQYRDAMAAQVGIIADEKERDTATEWLQWCERHIDSVDPLRRPLAMPAIRPPTWKEHSALLEQVMTEMAGLPPK